MIRMDQDDPVIEGYLLFPLHGNVLNKITKKKTCQPKYCMLFNSSKQGIERLEVYDSKEDVAACSCQKIITLENCIKITRMNSNNIYIVTKSIDVHLSASTDDETIKWLKALQSVAFKDDISSKVGNIDEDNDLYCSSTEGIFSVILCTSEASVRSGLEPIRYNLSIARSSIELINPVDRKTCASWPYKYIRRYGCRQGIFAFEAGRKCETGEGTFHFEKCNHQEIFRCLSMKIKSMKKKMFGDPLHSLDCGDQLQAALSMEARSRSPLPLSSRSEDLKLNPISFKSTSSHLSIDSQSPLVNNISNPGSKPKPVKPPRKHILPVTKERFETDKVDLGKYNRMESESLSSSRQTLESTVLPYDSVEVRSDAWRTMGLNEINHREFSQQSTPDNNSIKFISRSQDNIDSCGSGETSKIIILPSPKIDPCDANYDRLQYFTSSSKAKRSDTYNVVVTRPTAQNTSNSIDTWEDYDKVENVMQPARCADDSYLGYGMIRKPSIPGPQVPNKSKIVTTPESDDLSAYSDVDHCEHNGSQYAIVSKPKRV